MDDPQTLKRASGGDVEPLEKQERTRSVRPVVQSARRFELRDPFAEVTHRSASFDVMTRTAERLGATRFVAVEPDGRTSAVSKIGDQWLGPQPTLDAKPRRPAGVQVAAPAISADRPSRDRTSGDTEKPNTDQAVRLAALEKNLSERYVIRRAPLRIGEMTVGHTEYRHRGDPSRVAFTESTRRLSTDTNSPSVARAMVDVAESRNWSALRVSGSEDFKRMVWLEASLRGIRTVGYDRVPGDLDLLRKEREARQLDRSQPHAASSPNPLPDPKDSARGGGRKTVLAALEAVLVDRKVPTKQREIVMAAAAESLIRRTRNGESQQVKIYDASAAARRSKVTPQRVAHRMQERVGPAR